MKSVSAREANRRFSRLLAAAVDGEEFIITRRGRPVAKLVPLSRPDAEETRRNRAFDHLMSLIEKGVHLGGLGFSRDEAHER